MPPCLNQSRGFPVHFCEADRTVKKEHHMAIKVERLPNEPIIIYHYPEKLAANSEITEALQEAITLHQSTMDDDPIIWVIHNATQLKVDFSTVITMLATLTRDGPEGFDDPRIKAAAVTQNDLIRLVAKASRQEQYGSWYVKIFETLDEAITYAREDIAKGS
jgi:hypothetical protein